jgi:hypothetical protein
MKNLTMIQLLDCFENEKPKIAKIHEDFGNFMRVVLDLNFMVFLHFLVPTWFLTCFKRFLTSSGQTFENLGQISLQTFISIIFWICVDFIRRSMTNFIFQTLVTSRGQMTENGVKSLNKV